MGKREDCGKEGGGKSGRGRSNETRMGKLKEVVDVEGCGQEPVDSSIRKQSDLNNGTSKSVDSSACRNHEATDQHRLACRLIRSRPSNPCETRGSLFYGGMPVRFSSYREVGGEGARGDEGAGRLGARQPH